VTTSAPVLELCRALVAAGHDPASRLDAYRGDVLCLQVRSIGEAARLEINGHGTGFKRAGGGGYSPAHASNAADFGRGPPDPEAIP